MAEFHPVYFFWPSFWRSPTGWLCTGSSSLWDQTQRTSHICSGPPDSSEKPSSQWCPQASPPVRAERKPLKTSASIPHIYIWCIFFNAAQLSCIQYDIMIGFNVKKCILKSRLPGMYWNVWVLWISWQDWWLKIWIYIRTKKLLISPFASTSNHTYSLCPETKTVRGNSCYTYCCLRHKKHGLVKLYNNTYTFTMSTEEFIHSKTCLNWHLHIQIHKM